MRKLVILATVLAGGTIASGGAQAADLITQPQATPIISNTAGGFDWNGAYAGVLLSGQTGGLYALGANLGVNAMLDSNLLVGGEGSLTRLRNDSWEGQGNGKLGAAVGNLAFYGLAGVGYNSKSETYIPVGLGAELALGAPASIKAEYQYQYDINNRADDAHVAKVGLNFHF